MTSILRSTCGASPRSEGIGQPAARSLRTNAPSAAFLFVIQLLLNTCIMCTTCTNDSRDNQANLREGSVSRTHGQLHGHAHILPSTDKSRVRPSPISWFETPNA